MLGLRSPDERGTTAIALPPGSVLAFFTDGLVEATKDVIAGQRAFWRRWSLPQSPSAHGRRRRSQTRSSVARVQSTMSPF